MCWTGDVSGAVLADVAILEVALRNALHSKLSEHFGTEQWYLEEVGLDDRSQAALAEAWQRLKKPHRTPGRIVARLMLGFWCDLLDAGGHTGKEPQRFRCDYEQSLWRTAGLYQAFPGGKSVASTTGDRFTRSYVFTTVSIIRDLRNRAAHHEPFINGFPLDGQRDKHGDPLRSSIDAGREACLRLAGCSTGTSPTGTKSTVR